MPYFTPPGGDVTANFARSLTGYAPMSWYVPGVRTDLHGLAGGAPRFNRSVARGMYQLPFVDAPPRGYGLGQISVDPGLLGLGVGLLGLGLFLFGRKHPRKRRSRRGRLSGLFG